MFVLKTKVSLLKCQQSLWKYSRKKIWCHTRKSWRFLFNDETSVNKVLKHCGNHPSVSKIKCYQNETLNFNFPTAKVEDINNIIKSFNPYKSSHVLKNWKLEKTFRQQKDGRDSSHRSLKGIWLYSTWLAYCKSTRLWFW